MRTPGSPRAGVGAPHRLPSTGAHPAVCPASPVTDGQAPAGALRAGTQERQAAWMSVVSGLWGTVGAVGRTD